MKSAIATERGAVAKPSQEFMDPKIKIKSVPEEKLGFQEVLIWQCEAVIDAVKACILLGGFVGGKYQYSNGIAIFFPWTIDRYLSSIRNYGKLKFVKYDAHNWDQFVYTYLYAISRRSSKSTKASPEIDTYEDVTDWKGPSLKSVDPKDITKIYNFKDNRVYDQGGNTYKYHTEENAKYDPNGNVKYHTEDNSKYHTEGNAKYHTEDNSKYHTENNEKYHTEDNAKYGAAAAAGGIDFKNVAETWYIFGFTKDAHAGTASAEPAAAGDEQEKDK